MNRNSFRAHVNGFGDVLVEARGIKGLLSVSLYHNGKHHRRALKTANKQVAIERLSDVVTAILEDRLFRPLVDRRIDFEAGLEAYVGYLKSEHKSPKTIAQMRLRNREFFRHLASLGISRFEAIEPIHADSFRADLKKRCGNSTVFGYFRCAKTMLRFLVSRQLIQHDPFENIRFHRPEFRHSVIPTLDQVNLILPQVSERYKVAISTLAMLGCRRAELARIRCTDVDLRAKSVFIRKPEKYSSKTVSRHVPIHPRLDQLLREFKRPRSKWYFCTLPSPRNEKGGRQMKADFLNDEFKRAAELVGLSVGRSTENGLTLHSLRGFFKSHAILSGIPREVVDTWQGHRSDRSASFVHYFDLPKNKSFRLMASINFGGDGNATARKLMPSDTARAFYLA